MPGFSVPRIPRGPGRWRRLGEARKHITRGSVPRPMPSDVRGELSYLEKKVLLALKDLGKASPDEVQARGRFGELVEVMNAASWLQAKGLLTMRERVERSYRLARGDLARRLLPERKALKALLRAKGRLPVPRLATAPPRARTSRQELVREREAVRRELALTERGAMVVAAGLDLKEEVARPTTALLRAGRWKQGEFRPYDAKAFAPPVR